MPLLRTHERLRVAERVGQTTPIDAGPIVDTSSLVEKLAADPGSRDSDYWVYSPEERSRIVQSLFLADGAPWVARFGFLLSMSVIIATLGLANNQPAAVIAAMVIAPLMTPVLGIAAGVMLGLVRQVARLTLIVLASSAAAVAFGWLVSFTLVVHDVTAEELSRTTPRMRDFAIALAAGAAGMYGIVRKDLSGVLPGVAIAVALVPPLGTIGIVLELGEWSLARGAALLYAMNIVAIVLAAMVVLVVTDFISSPSIRNPKVIIATVFLLMVAVAIAIPVWNNSRELDERAVFIAHVSDAVLGWSESHPGYEIFQRTVEQDSVSLVIVGVAEPPLKDLRDSLATSAYPDLNIDILWVPATEP